MAKTNWQVDDIVRPEDLNALGEEVNTSTGKMNAVSGHQHTGAPGDAPKLTSTGLANGAATDPVIGNRTANPDTSTPYGLTGTLTQWFSWVTKYLKAITGKANPFDPPDMTLSDVKGHVDASAPHSGHALTSRTIQTSGGLSGGGNLSADRTISISDGGVTDNKVGNRTVNDAAAPTGDTAQLGVMLGWIGHMLKAITGKSSWRTAPARTLEDVHQHIGAGGAAHAAATGATAGFMAAADKAKLDGVAAGAQVNSVTSVAGRTGAVALAKADVGLGNVDNVQQAPLTHVGAGGAAHPAATNSVAGFMSTGDKVKLDGIATGANNYVHPATHPPGIIAQDASNRFVTDAEKASWNGKASTATATTSVNGLMSSTDKSKLDGIAAGAQVNRAVASQAQAEAGTDNATDMTPLRVAQAIAVLAPPAPVQSVAGKTGAVTLGKADVGLSSVDNVQQAPLSHVGAGGSAHAAATTSVAGFMSAADKTKLDGVAAGANNYVHPATHPPGIIAQDASNRFVTDAEKASWNAKASTATATTSVNGLMSSTDKSKLDGVAAGAQVNTVTSVAGKTGAVTLTGTDIPAATTGARGTVQLSTATDSTSTTLAATASAVKAAMDQANAAFQSGSEFKTDVAAAITASGVPTAANATKNTFVSNVNDLKVQTGINWTSRTSAADNNWRSVCYGNGLFVAVADNGTGNRVMTSSDGISWTSRTSAAANWWRSVCYGNGLFVAVSYNGTGNRVMTSPDGITWTSRTSAADNDWYSICYGNGLFVAVGITGIGNRVMTSPDGINWTSRTSAADNSWLSVCYGNGLFVAVAGSGVGNRVMTSPDGINWTIRTSAANNSWQSVCYGNGLFVAVSSSGTVMTSPNGITWTSRTSAAFNNWISVCYGNGLFVAVSWTGTGNRVMTSPDGITWTSRTSAADNNWWSVCYGNGLFVVVAYTGTGNRVMTSGELIDNTLADDYSIKVVRPGINWTSRTSAADNQWWSVCYGNGLFVAVSWTGTGNRVMTSLDGITWTIRNSVTDNNWYSVCYGNGLFVAISVAGTGNRVMTSPDGITWTSRTSAANNSWTSVCYGNGLFVAVSDTGTGNRVMTSPNGITWTIRTSAADNQWYSVCYGNGLFVAVSVTGTGNRVMTSPDGITWTIRTSAADNQWYSVCYGNGLFVAVSDTGTNNRVMTSPDGINWTSRTSAPDNNWRSVCYGNGLFVAVANTGTGNRVMTSPDGINWTIRTSAVDNSWQSVCYGNGLFVAVSWNGIGNRVMTSGVDF